MNVAILISGHFRTKEISKLYANHLQYLYSVNSNHKFTIFISTYDTDGLRKSFKHEDGTQDGLHNTFSGLTEEYIGRQFLSIETIPLFIEVENFNDIKPILVEKTKGVYALRESQIQRGILNVEELENRILANCSMWYKWHKVNELKLKAQLNFDMCLRLRADWMFNEQFELNEIVSPNLIVSPSWPMVAWLPNISVQRRPIEWCTNELNDWWCMGSEGAISIYCDLYCNYEKYFDDISKNGDYDTFRPGIQSFINPHRLPYLHLEKNDIEIKKTKIFGHPLKRVAENKILPRGNL